MKPSVHSRLLSVTQSKTITKVELIQPLWNNYGSLCRVHLQGGQYSSVILKHIQIPEGLHHPRGFASDISRQRKIRSYQVETHWYLNQNQQLDARAPTPQCLDAFDAGSELFLLLEDLATLDYGQPLCSVTWNEIAVVLRWLAQFHAHFIENPAEGLWPCGTYWHLETRPEELANIRGTRLHRYAALLDARLRCAAFPTIVHGDAKLANFCFSADHQAVAAVDFQYAGRGAAMKDLTYFIGSCLRESECQRLELQLLEVYFDALRSCLPQEVDAVALEQEWRELYPVAWADFQRFMLGWSPGHRKLTAYSDAISERAIRQITDELMDAATCAALSAGRFIQANRERPLQVASKGFASQASDVVTEIDLQAQAVILEHLAATVQRYDLGVLAEEGEQDDSRLRKHAFWTIDPLDGTQYFIEDRPGYATSIALVSQAGQTILGVVYDPINDHLYQSIRGEGVTLNGQPLPALSTEQQVTPVHWFADRSLRQHRDFQRYQQDFELRFAGGAVMNILQLLTHPNSCYVKAPKPSLGGCAIWDLAAVSLMLEELGGSSQFYDGQALQLNRAESVFFNDVGLVFASAEVVISGLMARVLSCAVEKG